MYNACKNAGYNFSLTDIKNWLNKQAIFQVHKPRPNFIPYASFINITVPMEVIQADLCYMPHDKIGKKIYKYALNCVDIASRTKWTYPLTDRDSTSVAKGLKYLFNSQKCPLSWPKKLQTDGGVEFLGECHAMLINHGVKHLLAKSKRSMGIVERFNLTLQKWAFYIQDAVELRLSLNKRC
ncbi:5991_t:CDS:1 [Entrophospora sp. SA101]|nr:5991_t:CDS:1 [Entrophospora sp. SA101]CAJ0826157.1 2637_t:CDS:1 [Entrophospora sp. SA101]CAJ0826540.1 6827_t:CDS:1 [Entrophospora sp. SA101]